MDKNLMIKPYEMESLRILMQKIIAPFLLVLS